MALMTVSRLMQNSNKMKYTLIFLCLLLTGCPSNPVNNHTPAPTQLTGELGTKHITKETTIGKAADSIETTNQAKYKDAVITENVTTIKTEIKNAPTQELLTAAKNDAANKDATIKALEEQITKLNAFVKKLQDLISSRQVWFFNIGGGALLALAGAAAYFGRVQWALILGALGLGCLGVAQLVGLVWFKYVVFSLGALGFIAIVVALIMDANKHKAHVSVDQEATDYYSVLTKMIPAFDKAYANATPEQQKWLKENLLTELSGKYSDPDKALIHTIRADIVKARTIF